MNRYEAQYGIVDQLAIWSLAYDLPFYLGLIAIVGMLFTRLLKTDRRDVLAFMDYVAFFILAGLIFFIILPAQTQNRFFSWRRNLSMIIIIIMIASIRWFMKKQKQVEEFNTSEVNDGRIQER